MGAIRKPTPVDVDGQPSQVQARCREQDLQDGWSIEVRPCRRALSDEELLHDANTEPSTCLAAGNRILMAGGGVRPIEQVRPGDQVMTLTGPRLVEDTESTTLGLSRRLIELRGLGDQALRLSSDHPLWVSRAGREWWGTYNIHHVLYEMRQCAGYELRELPYVLRIDLPEQVAHESGWLPVRPVFHDLPPSTVLHHLVIAGGCSYIAEGFPVFSHCRDEQGPREPWLGVEAIAEPRHHGHRLVPEVIV